jgi:hypothetical protein
VEEAERVSERSWEILIPTVGKTGSEIWVMFVMKVRASPLGSSTSTNARVQPAKQVIVEPSDPVALA